MSTTPIPRAKQMLESFFDESKEQSQVKARIVEKYFDTWASIITAVQDWSGRSRDPRIAYVDLFCGPGRYKDGAQSTPLKIIEKAINNPTYNGWIQANCPLVDLIYLFTPLPSSMSCVSA